MGAKIFLNGELVERDQARVSVFDHGLLYGDGVFEGIRSYRRRVFKLKEHIDRLYESAEAISLKIPLTKQEMTGGVLKTLKENGLDDAYIRCVVTRGVGDLGLDPRKCEKPTIFIITDKISLYPRRLYEEGLPITLAKTRRNHPATVDPRIKSLNYLNNILGRIEAIQAGVEEALMLTIEGYVAECTGDNVFVVKNGHLVTAPSDIGALEGITRNTVISLAARKGIKTEYKLMRPEQLIESDECFLTGTAAEIIPVVDLDGEKIGKGVPGPLTKMLSDEYKNLTEAEGMEY